MAAGVRAARGTRGEEDAQPQLPSPAVVGSVLRASNPRPAKNKSSAKYPRLLAFARGKRERHRGTRRGRGIPRATSYRSPCEHPEFRPGRRTGSLTAHRVSEKFLQVLC